MLLLPGVFFAQPPELYLDTLLYFGGKRNDVAKQVIQNMDGNFVVVGISDSKKRSEKKVKPKDKSVPKGDEDAFFVILNRQGKVKKKIILGGYGKDGANAVVQTFDGGYVIVGYSDSPNSKEFINKKEAWVIKIDQNGNKLWEQEHRYRTSKDEEFRDIIQLDDGSLILTGNKDNRLFVLKLDPWGNKLREDAFATSSEFRSVGNRVLLTSDNILWIVGETQNDKGNVMGAFWGKYDLNCNRLGNFQHYNREYAAAIDIVEKENKQLLLLCQSYGSPADMVLITIDKYGVPIEKNPKKYKRLIAPGKEDVGRAMIKGLDNNIYITGGTKYSNNRKRNEHRKNAFLLRLNGGDLSDIDEPYIFGDNATNYINSLFQADDGSILLAGEAFLKEEWGFSSDANFLRVKLKVKPEQPNIVINKLEFFDGERRSDHTLEPGERGYFLIHLTNASPYTAYQLHARMQRVNKLAQFVDCKGKGLNFGYLKPGASKVISYPVQVHDDLKEHGDAEFQLVIKDEFTELAETALKMRVRPTPKPSLVVECTNLQPENGSVINKEKPITLEVVIANKGDLVAEKCRFVFNYDYEVEMLSGKKEFRFPQIDPGEEVTVSLRFHVLRTYEGEEVNIKLTGYADNQDEFKYGHMDEFFFMLGERGKLCDDALPVAIHPKTDFMKKGGRTPLNDLYLYDFALWKYRSHEGLSDLLLLKNDEKVLRSIFGAEKGLTFKNINLNKKSKGEGNKDRVRSELMDLQNFTLRNAITPQDFIIVYLAGYFVHESSGLKILASRYDDDFDSIDKNIDLKDDVFQLLAEIENENILLIMDAYVLEKNIDGYKQTVSNDNICKIMQRTVVAEERLNIICSCQGNMLSERKVVDTDWKHGLLNTVIQQAKSNQEYDLDKDDNGFISIKELLQHGKFIYNKENINYQQDSEIEDKIKKEYLPRIWGNSINHNFNLFKS